MKRIFVVSLVLAFVVISCSAQGNSLNGTTWRFTSEEVTFDIKFTQTKMTLIKNSEDGEELESGDYRVDGNKIYPLDDDGKVETYWYLLIHDKNTLYFVTRDGKSYPGKRIEGSTSSSTSNQKNSIIGTYTSDGDSFLESIEIIDDKNVILNYDVLGMTSSFPATYKIIGTTRLTVTNGKDTILFEIGRDSLKGLTIGSTGTFYKE